MVLFGILDGLMQLMSLYIITDRDSFRGEKVVLSMFESFGCLNERSVVSTRIRSLG